MHDLTKIGIYIQASWMISLQSLWLVVVLSVVNNPPTDEVEHSFHLLPVSSGNMIQY
jgi:hypothetical protein